MARQHEPTSFRYPQQRFDVNNQLTAVAPEPERRSGQSDQSYFRFRFFLSFVNKKK